MLPLFLVLVLINNNNNGTYKRRLLCCLYFGTSSIVLFVRGASPVHTNTTVMVVGSQHVAD